MTATTPSSSIALVLTTESDRHRARSLAHALIERRLAACVSMRDVESVFRWDGQLVDDSEVELVIKTTPDRVIGLCAAIVELHSYDLPEVVVLHAAAAQGYGRWVRDEVSAN